VGSILIIPGILSGFGFPFIQSSLALCLLGICLFPTAKFLSGSDNELPVLPVLCFSYAAQYALPIFLDDPALAVINGVAYQKNEDIVAALLLTIAGVSMLQAGYFLLHLAKVRRLLPCISLPVKKSRARIYSMTVLFLLFAITNLQSLIPGDLYIRISAFVTLLQNQVLVAIGILGWMAYTGEARALDKLVLYALVLFASIRGVSTGMIEPAVIPFAVLFVTRWLYTRRLPVKAMVAAGVLIFFLSPVKAAFRQTVWHGGSEESDSIDAALSNASLWASEAFDYWSSTIGGQRTATESTAAALSRTDLIHQLSHIYSLTPSQIPFQNGETYSYFLVTFVPRVIWPEKPIAGSANAFYGINYGITTEEGARHSTFGISLIGEGYINFGIFGVIVIMALQGAILAILQQVFAGTESGPGGKAVFLAFFVFFLNGVGTSADIFFGNIIQNLFCGCMLLWWARQRLSNPLLKRARVASSLYPAS